MALENKLGITDSAELAREEERISKKKAVQMFESGAIAALPVGTFAALKEIHRYLLRLRGQNAHGESRKGQFPLCAADVS